jgi:hypothetical protein
MLLLVFLGLIVNGIISHLIGNLGKEKKIGYSTSFWVSFLFSPIIGILMVIGSVPKPQEEIETKIEPTTISKIDRELTAEEKKKLSKIEDILTIVIGIVGLCFILYISFK